ENWRWNLLYAIRLSGLPQCCPRRTIQWEHRKWRAGTSSESKSKEIWWPFGISFGRQITIGHIHMHRLRCLLIHVEK
ncbi:hypothetical protein PMAYCL1PPCAC_11179, partial [Pristionchus mayeri]